MKNFFFFFFLVSCIVVSSCGFAGDLDDGISKYTDDGIGKWDELGKADLNIKFIVLNAKSKATLGNDAEGTTGGGSGDANMNSVVMGPGSRVKGDIIIIDQSRGSKTNVAQ